MTSENNQLSKPNSLLNIDYSHDHLSQKSISDNEIISLDYNNTYDNKTLSSSQMNQIHENILDPCQLSSKQFLNIHSNDDISLSKLDKMTKSSITKLNKFYDHTQNESHKSSLNNNNASRHWKKLQCTMKVVLSSMDHVKFKRKLYNNNDTSRRDSFMYRFSTQRRGTYSNDEYYSDTNYDHSFIDQLYSQQKLDHYHCIPEIALLYNLWTPIARQAFDELQSKYQIIWLSFDILADLIYLIDIFVQCNTSYLKCGLKVRDHQKLAKCYMKSYKFLLDLLSLFPLDLIQFKIGIQPMLRFPRFFKWYRCHEWKIRVENRTIFPNLWRVLNLIHILFLGCHWFASFYYLISKYEGFKNPWGYQPYTDAEQVTMSRRYLKSFYWATLTLTTIGDLSSPSSSIE
uniref:Cyclic nucleotide-gated olfactory channel n=1 Tax=Schistosoma haematobium TaxID=6185 RepID=A0A094ZI65_SCHHA